MKHSSRHSGFTLTELLVVIGIIALLVGVLLPVLARAQRMGSITKCKAQMQQIAQGLDNYFIDFGDYPRITAGAYPTGVVTGTPPYSPTGPQILCWGLAALGPMSQDGADGPGFRKPVGNAFGTASVGRVYGPYIVVDKFQFTCPNNPADDSAEILDPWGKPFLYFPARLGHPAINTPNSYVANSTTSGTQPLYDWIYTYYYNNNTSPSTWSATPPSTFPLATMQAFLGANANGSAATPVYTGPYILWSAGPDRTYGSQGPDNKYGDSDDVTTFNQ